MPGEPLDVVRSFFSSPFFLFGCRDCRRYFHLRHFHDLLCDSSHKCTYRDIYDCSNVVSVFFNCIAVDGDVGLRRIYMSMSSACGAASPDGSAVARNLHNLFD